MKKILFLMVAFAITLCASVVLPPSGVTTSNEVPNQPTYGVVSMQDTINFDKLVLSHKHDEGPAMIVVGTHGAYGIVKSNKMIKLSAHITRKGSLYASNHLPLFKVGWDASA